MKNNLKIFVAIVITFILTLSGTVYAISAYRASDIAFTPNEENKNNGFNASNVEEALNSLYENSILNLEVGTFYAGNVTSSTSLSTFKTFTLSKGKYIVYYTYSAPEGGMQTQISGCSNSNLLSRSYNSNYAVSDAKSGRGNVTTMLYYCEVDADDTDVTISTAEDQYSVKTVVRAFANYIKLK